MEDYFIDTHSHLNLSPLSDEVETVIKKMKEKRTKTILVGVDFETSKQAVGICKSFPDTCLGATIGQHPNDNKEEIFDFDACLLLAKEKEVVGIGECGLDYFRLNGTEEEIYIEKERQISLFKKHVSLAKEINKMLMIHARPSKGTMDAYTDVLDILEKENFTGKVNFHFFVGDVSVAKRVVEHGWSMSFDGPITFTNEYDEVLTYVPLENMLCETDAPFAAPAPYRGQICKPWMVEEVYKKVSEIKKLPLDLVVRQLKANAKLLFGLFT